MSKITLSVLYSLNNLDKYCIYDAGKYDDQLGYPKRQLKLSQ